MASSTTARWQAAVSPSLRATRLNDVLDSRVRPAPWISRPRRCLWRGVLLVGALAIVVLQFLTRTPTDVRHGLYVAGGLCVLAWAAELVTRWRISRLAGSLKTTEKHVRDLIAGPLVRGGTFGAWPQHSGQFGVLLDEVIEELQLTALSGLHHVADHRAVQPFDRARRRARRGRSGRGRV